MKSFIVFSMLFFHVFNSAEAFSESAPPDSLQDVYYAYYATTFDLMQMDANGKDEAFESLKNKFAGLCRFEKSNITYSPKRLATKKGIEKTIRYLLGMDMDRNKRNHLVFILNGFTATDSSFHTVSVNSARDEFSYGHLFDCVKRYLPVSSVFFIFNFYKSETADFQVESISTLMKSQFSIPYAALVCKNSSPQSPDAADGLGLFLDSFQGGADADLDQTLATAELKKYLDLKAGQNTDTTQAQILLSASTDSSFNLQLTPIQADTFSLRTFTNRSYTYSPRANSVPHIMVFGTTWCIPCRAEKSDLKSLLKSFPTNRIVYISEDDSEQYAEARKQAAGYPFIFLFDIGQEIYSRFADRIGYPLTVILDKSGTIRYKKRGYDATDKLIIENIMRKLNQN